jgi:hypothetical protein
MMVRHRGRRRVGRKRLATLSPSSYPVQSVKERAFIRRKARRTRPEQSILAVLNVLDYGTNDVSTATLSYAVSLVRPEDGSPICRRAAPAETPLVDRDRSATGFPSNQT